MNPTLLMRLALAKTFLNKAHNALKQGSDELSLATAVVDMHDCIDNFLGVLSSELHAERPKKDYMTNRFTEVNKKYTEKYTDILPNESDVTLLNDVRNGVKHSGVIPNPTQVISLVKSLTDFCNIVCEKVFGLRLEDVSLVAQVTNKEKRSVLETIEKNITAHKFKEAMEKAADALFEYHDSNAPNLSGLFQAMTRHQSGGQKPKANLFPERDVQQINLKLLEEGIDPYLYYRFGNLVPRIGFNNLLDKNYIYEYSSSTWHEKNWTAENATFCLNFLTKLFFGQQRDYSGYHIVNKQVRHRVTFLKNSDVTVGLGDRTEVNKFTKGDQLDGLVDGFINDELIGHREGLPDKIELTEIDTATSHYEKYLIEQADVKIETIAESYRDTNI